MNPTTDSWLNSLPPELAAHAAALRRLTAAVEEDPRLRALEVTGSVGRGTGDANSDLDVIIATHDALWPAMTQEIPELAQALGGIVDLVAFPLPHSGDAQPVRFFVLYEEGLQLDLTTLPARLLPGRMPNAVVLYDPDGRLAVEAKPPGKIAITQEAQLWDFLAWEALMRTDKEIGRGNLWSALEWLQTARGHFFRLWAAAHEIPFPGEGLVSVLRAPSKKHADLPAGLAETVPHLTKQELRNAATACAGALVELRAQFPSLLGGKEPRPLAQSMMKRLHPEPRPRPRRSSKA